MRVKNRLVIVIPAWNEAPRLAAVLRRVPHLRLAEMGLQTQILVIDDGSTDQTARVAKDAGADHVIVHTQNRGLGATIREGLQWALATGATVAVMIDADGEYPPEAIPDVVAPILYGSADYVLGSRFMGSIRGMRLSRRLGNYAFTLLQSILAGRWITDGQTGLRAFHRTVLSGLRIIHDYNYAQVMTLNILRREFRMAEIPITYQVRQGGKSFIRFGIYLRRVLPAIWAELREPVQPVGRMPAAHGTKATRQVHA